MNYQNAKIYKIVNRVNSKCYVGSTTQSLTQRLCEHRSKFNKNKGIYTSKVLFAEDYDGCDIILLEKFPCNDKDELKQKEREWIEKLDCVNRIIVGRTKQEYKETHKEEKKATDKAYYEKNKAFIRSKVKEYRLNNLEEARQKEKVYRDRRKDKIAEKFQCECGGSYCSRHYKAHCLTKKHLSHLSSKKV